MPHYIINLFSVMLAIMLLLIYPYRIVHPIHITSVRSPSQPLYLPSRTGWYVDVLLCEGGVVLRFVTRARTDVTPLTLSTSIVHIKITAVRFHIGIPTCCRNLL